MEGENKESERIDKNRRDAQETLNKKIRKGKNITSTIAKGPEKFAEKLKQQEKKYVNKRNKYIETQKYAKEIEAEYKHAVQELERLKRS